jgi:hypothetical protein
MEAFSGSSPHRPLSSSDPSEIRLAVLEGGSLDSDIRCTLKHVSLNSTTERTYIALSYAWGDPNETATIHLDGQPYPVTNNLASFLRHAQRVFSAVLPHFPRGLLRPYDNARMLRHCLFWQILQDLRISHQLPKVDRQLSIMVRDCFRKMLLSLGEAPESGDEIVSGTSLEDDRDDSSYSPELSLYLWIDAICINQKDLAERSVQVTRMRDIYIRATTVFIWLGEATADTDDVLGFLCDLDKLKSVWTGCNIEWSVVKALITSPQFINPRKDAIQKLQTVLCRDWFRRMWIIQGELCSMPKRAENWRAPFLLGIRSSTRTTNNLETVL